MVDFLSEKYSGSTEHKNSCTSRESYSQDADDGLEHSVYNQGVASSSPIIGSLKAVQKS